MTTSIKLTQTRSVTPDSKFRLVGACSEKSVNLPDNAMFLFKVSDQTYQHMCSVGDVQTYQEGIVKLVFQNAGYVSCVPGDVGKVVTGSAGTGTLRRYDNSTKTWWIEQPLTGTLSGAVTIASGTGAGTISTATAASNYYRLDQATLDFDTVEDADSEMATQRSRIQFFVTDYDEYYNTFIVAPNPFVQTYTSA